MQRKVSAKRLQGEVPPHRLLCLRCFFAMSGAEKGLHFCFGRSPEIACLELAHILTKAALPVTEPHLAPQRRENKWRKTTFRGAWVTHLSVSHRPRGVKVSGGHSTHLPFLGTPCWLDLSSRYCPNPANYPFRDELSQFLLFLQFAQILWSFSAIPLISFSFSFVAVRIHSFGRRLSFYHSLQWDTRFTVNLMN